MKPWFRGSRGKYRNTWTKCDGFNFQSKLEADRWMQLRLLERAGQISDLRRQVEYWLIAGDVLAAVYVADFVYVENGKEVVEDTKGTITKEFEIKYALMKGLLGIEVKLTGKNGKPKALAYRIVEKA
jgi:hypothetical protein